MKNNLYIITILFCFSISSCLFAENKIDSLLKVLDKTLEGQQIYDSQKETRILNYKQKLNSKINPNDRHQQYFNLFKEYEAYIFDSAVHYAEEHLLISQKENNPYWKNECKMQLARMYSTYARFPEAIDLLNSINRKELSSLQLGNYYISYEETYIYWGEYEECDKFTELKNLYLDSAIIVLPDNSWDYKINYSRRCIETKMFEEAKQTLSSCIPLTETDTRNYAILMALMSYLCESEGNNTLEKEYLAKSAITDIRASVKENTSLRTLALYLMQDKDLSRANRYIKKSLDDANFYNARLRNVQISKILPIIDKAYQIERDQYNRNMHIAIVSIAFMLLLVVILAFYLYKQMKRLRRTRKEIIIANKNLKRTNEYLAETSQIKDEYLGLFLNQCSGYIDKLETYRKNLNKKAAAGKLEDLYTMLKSSQIIEDELKEFYNKFDIAFLNIFPDFVEKFNLLLPEEERVYPKNDHSLTIELRIFALIRLGITDSSKIANFLRYSITTIYNYRSKYRNKALVGKDNFEETIMKLG